MEIVRIEIRILPVTWSTDPQSAFYPWKVQACFSKPALLGTVKVAHAALKRLMNCLIVIINVRRTLFK